MGFVTHIPEGDAAIDNNGTLTRLNAGQKYDIRAQIKKTSDQPWSGWSRARYHSLFPRAGAEIGTIPRTPDHDDHNLSELRAYGDTQGNKLRVWFKTPERANGLQISGILYKPGRCETPEPTTFNSTDSGHSDYTVQKVRNPDNHSELNKTRQYEWGNWPDDATHVANADVDRTPEPRPYLALSGRGNHKVEAAHSRHPERRYPWIRCAER